MKYTVDMNAWKWLLLPFCIFSISNVCSQNPCDNPNVIVESQISVGITWSGGNCSFSLTATAANTSNVCDMEPNACRLGIPCLAVNHCYHWRLFSNAGGSGFTLIDNHCAVGSSNNTHTFSGLTAPGIYTVDVKYRRAICNPTVCITFADQGSIVVSDSENVCPFISALHSNNEEAIIARSELVTLDCPLQNNQHTVIMSAEKITALSGSSSGTGSFFHAKIEECPAQKWEGDDGDAYSSSHQTDHTNMTVLESINNLSALNPTDRRTISTTLYPNPTNGLLTFRHSQTISYVEVFDVMGRAIVRSSPNTTSATIDLSGNAPGIHFIRATLEDGRTETHRAVLLSP